MREQKTGTASGRGLSVIGTWLGTLGLALSAIGCLSGNLTDNSEPTVVSTSGKSTSAESADDQVKKPDSRVLRLFGGEDGWQILEYPTRVEAYRVEAPKIEKSDLRGPPTQAVNLESAKKLSDAVELNPDLTQNLSELLRNPQSYDWKSKSKPCEPTPEIAVRFTRNASNLDVMFCFECGILIVYRDGRWVGTKDFEDSHADFVVIMKQAFPNDKLVQGFE